MVRATSRRADQPHGGGDGKARKIEPASRQGNLPAAVASQDRRRAAQGGRDRFSCLRPQGMSAGTADHHHLRAAAAAHSAKNRGRGAVRRYHPGARLSERLRQVYPVTSTERLPAAGERAGLAIVYRIRGASASRILRCRQVYRLCARNAYLYRGASANPELPEHPNNQETLLVKFTGTAPPTCGRCGLKAVRIALVSGVAWSCLAGLAGSAEAATRGMGAPYGWDDGWYAPPAAVPPRQAPGAPTRKEKAEPKKDAGFGPMPKGPLQIVVSIGSQKVTLFSNGVRVAQGPVSTGVPGRPTPTGVFSIIEKDRYHHSNLYSNAPMPYMQRITWSGVALHEGVLPGYPASHGCI